MADTTTQCHDALMTATQQVTATRNMPAYLAPIFGAFALILAIAPAATIICVALVLTAVTLGIIGYARDHSPRALAGVGLASAAVVLSIISLNM